MMPQKQKKRKGPIATANRNYGEAWRMDRDIDPRLGVAGRSSLRHGPWQNFPQSLFSRPFYCWRLSGMRVSAWFMYPLLSIAGEEIQ